MNQLDTFLKTVMDQAVSEAPDDLFDSVESMVGFVDRAGEIASKEFIKWQPRPPAKVLQMPKRRRAKG
jgi:hypothetical protein